VIRWQGPVRLSPMLRPLHSLPAAVVYVPRLAPLFGIGLSTPGGAGVALTFDDGPHPQATPAVLNLLEKHGVRATFFLVGEQVQRRPELAREIVDAGHTVGIHCYRHRSLLRLQPREVREDLTRAAATIEDATAKRLHLYRPPYGRFALAALVHARRSHWRCVLWSLDSQDWHPDATVSSIEARIGSGLRSGDVLVFHDADFYGPPLSWRLTVTALPGVLDELNRRNMALVAL
jgi:peptidoglycan/xylan/chitin deacetylase (PgdA/CDA1 family)